MGRSSTILLSFSARSTSTEEGQARINISSSGETWDSMGVKRLPISVTANGFSPQLRLAKAAAPVSGNITLTFVPSSANKWANCRASASDCKAISGITNSTWTSL